MWKVVVSFAVLFAVATVCQANEFQSSLSPNLEIDIEMNGQIWFESSLLVAANTVLITASPDGWANATLEDGELKISVKDPNSDSASALKFPLALFVVLMAVLFASPVGVSSKRSFALIAMFALAVLIGVPSTTHANTSVQITITVPAGYVFEQLDIEIEGDATLYLKNITALDFEIEMEKGAIVGDWLKLAPVDGDDTPQWVWNLNEGHINATRIMAANTQSAHSVNFRVESGQINAGIMYDNFYAPWEAKIYSSGSGQAYCGLPAKCTTYRSGPRIYGSIGTSANITGPGDAKFGVTEGYFSVAISKEGLLYSQQ